MATIQRSRAAAPAQLTRLSLGQLLNVPNAITLCRLSLIPVFLGLLSKRDTATALYVFAAAAATDALDGTVARWFDCRTEIGAILDPFADKLLLLSSFVALTFNALMPVWLLGVIIIRDIVLVFGYVMVSFFSAERIPVRPSYLGKAATCLQIASVVGALIQLEASRPLVWSVLLDLTAGLTALSGTHYVYRGLVWLSSREPEMFA
ncbi:MAG TPA: CDP-alcohol phosphatidyltransferase family protein [Candidatus Binataceae bacterium]|jgi:cardiolipin synthase|nr:CDP-alcohol phosphatidyltransferase family protein [Candidatus Binataceae bacterium]